jgi:tRNA threonylcarbamoyladenosine biosynthesis protein TsaE
MELEFALNDIRGAANDIWAKGQDYKVWAFHGEMGSGKTTFIHVLCEVLGVTSAIGSPTYSIINEYKSAAAGTIFHMDWYRLKDEEEALQAGVEDALYSGNVCLVEWPDRAAGLLPENTLHLELKILTTDTRLIVLNSVQ